MKPLMLAVLAAVSAQDLKIVPNGSLRHPSHVTAIEITPDSQKVFVARDDGWLVAHSLKTRKQLELGLRCEGNVPDLAINSRGDRIAVPSGGERITIFDTTSLKAVVNANVPSNPERLEFSRDDKSLWVAMGNGHLAKLKASDLSMERDIFPTEGSRILALAISRDGSIVATADREGMVKLWAASSLKEVAKWKVHEPFASSLAFDPTGRHLVSGGANGSVKVWRMSDRSLLKESKEYHQQFITTIAFAGDGRFVTGGFDGLCQFWDGNTFAAGKSYPNYRGYITAGAISADRRWLVRGGSSLDFVSMDRPDEYERVAEYGGAIMGFAVASDMKRCVSGGLDRRLILWRVDDGVTSKSDQLQDWITAVDFCGDGNSIVAGLANGAVEIYSAATMQRERSWVAHNGRIIGVASLNRQVVTIGDDARVHVWDVQGKRLKSHEQQSPCRSVAVRGKRYAVGSADGSISVYDSSTHTLVRQVRGRPLSVTALGFSRDGARLLVGYFDGAIEAWDAGSWSVVRYRAGTGSSVLSIDANTKNELIAVGFRDGYARLVDSATLNDGPSVRTTPPREVFSIRWMLSDRSFAVAGANNAVYFYSLNGDIAAWASK